MRRKNATNLSKRNKKTGESAGSPGGRAGSMPSPISLNRNAKGSANCGQPDQRLDAAATITAGSTTKAATSPPQAAPPQNWARYIDSRLKQFSLR